MRLPNFKTCQYLNLNSGTCRKSLHTPELNHLTHGKYEVQCCFLMPGIVTYECPNPIINPEAIVPKEAPPPTQEENIYGLQGLSDGDTLEAIIEILDTFRKENAILQHTIKQDYEEKIKSLEKRINTLEKTLYADQRNNILLPSAESIRPQPTKRSSKAAERNTENEDNNLEKRINSLDISEDLFKEDFFKLPDLELDDTDDE